MLAHKATHEAKVAAEVISGMKSHFDARTIPSVAYTDPEVAWMGKTETFVSRNVVCQQLKRRRVFRVAAVYGAVAFVVLQVQVTLDTPAMFMAVILITLIGVALYGSVLLLERLLVAKDARIA